MRYPEIDRDTRKSDACAISLQRARPPQIDRLEKLVCPESSTRSSVLPQQPTSNTLGLAVASATTHASRADRERPDLARIAHTSAFALRHAASRTSEEAPCCTSS